MRLVQAVAQSARERDHTMTTERPPTRSVTLYASQDQHLQVAQQVLDTHVTSSVTGRCLACGVPGPCLRRETAMAVWSR
jgi:hypothetical protein